MDKAPIKMFVGIRVPVDIAASLAEFRNVYSAEFPGVRWTDTDDLHITLKYLGPQTAQVAASITDGLNKISQPTVEIVLSGAGVFKDVGVLFISIVSAPVLMQLQQSVDQVALANGVARSEYPYRPHISIARFDIEINAPKSATEFFDRISRQLDEFCQRLPRCHFRATEIKLFESASGHYSELSNFELKA